MVITVTGLLAALPLQGRPGSVNYSVAQTVLAASGS
jgi:hypothetical protein